MERLDKAIAKLLVLSRSDARRLIKCGKVKVNGEIVKTFDTKIDENDNIQVEDKVFNNKQKVYYIMNKPQGVVCDSKSNSPYAPEVLPENMKRKDLFCVGRLDKDTTGLLIITNDGEYSHKVISPKSHIVKKYFCTFAEPLTNKAIEKIEKGLTLSDGTVLLPAKVQNISKDKLCADICISEGKYHQIKRMAGAIENKITSLKRTSIGGLELQKTLKTSQAMEINEQEAFKVFE